MQYLSKLLLNVEKNAQLFKEKDLNFILGLTTTQIKDLKKFAILNKFIEGKNYLFYLTEIGKEYLVENPVISWCKKSLIKRPEINLEYLKLEKAPPTLTRAIRLLARHLIENEELKENSTEHYLIKELLCEKSACANVKKEIEELILKDGKQKLTCIFEKFTAAPYGLTKSIVGILMLDILVKNKDILAIYENNQFQLKLNHLMFDRMIYCPEHFELQKTVLYDMPILEKISEIILPCISTNILDLTKGLIYFIRNLDKYTLSTERLSKKTLRFRNTILNAKDPISLFYRDIPKVLDDNILPNCKKSFIQSFQNSIEELQDCYSNLIEELYKFLFESFQEEKREKLTTRFKNAEQYLGNSELKILYNNVKEETSGDTLWIERIATFINKSRVPKDWSDADIADFKVKVKELALKFTTIESTIGTCEIKLDTTLNSLLVQLLNLPQAEKCTLLRKVVNI